MREEAQDEERHAMQAPEWEELWQRARISSYVQGAPIKGR